MILVPGYWTTINIAGVGIERSWVPDAWVTQLTLTKINEPLWIPTTVSTGQNGEVVSVPGHWSSHEVLSPTAPSGQVWVHNHVNVGSGVQGMIAVTLSNFGTLTTPTLVTIAEYNNAIVHASHADSTLWNNNLPDAVRYWTYTHGDGHITHWQEDI